MELAEDPDNTSKPLVSIQKAAYKSNNQNWCQAREACQFEVVTYLVFPSPQNLWGRLAPLVNDP